MRTIKWRYTHLKLSIGIFYSFPVLINNLQELSAQEIIMLIKRVLPVVWLIVLLVSNVYATDSRGISVKIRSGSESSSKAFQEFFIFKGEEKEDRLFVWFAGHGYTEDGEGYII